MIKSISRVEHPNFFPSEVIFKREAGSRKITEDAEDFEYLKFSDVSFEFIAEIKNQIITLEKEIQSCWPYPNKDRKAIKVQGLNALLEKLTRLDVSSAIEQVEKEFPEIRKGSISTRAADLLDRIKNSKAEPQIH